MEGKSAPEVKAKWEMAFVGSYSKSLCVFGPTQIVNFTLTPPQHRLAVQQLVGLGESSFLHSSSPMCLPLIALCANSLLLGLAAEEATLRYRGHLRLSPASIASN